MKSYAYINLTVVSKLKDYSKSNTATYDEKVVGLLFWKRYKVETWLLQTTNRK